FVDNFVQSIVQYGDKFKEFIKRQKNNVVNIVRYVRKLSHIKDKKKERARLLRRMINKLRSRSLIGNVFASRLSLTNKTFDKRDINDDDFEKPDGSTRGNTP
ncbi:hypothetical protein J3Q64DRAFT_1646854, partial [Phycomyces blakesleeanus]